MKYLQAAPRWKGDFSVSKLHVVQAVAGPIEGAASKRLTPTVGTLADWRSSENITDKASTFIEAHRTLAYRRPKPEYTELGDIALQCFSQPRPYSKPQPATLCLDLASHLGPLADHYSATARAAARPRNHSSASNRLVENTIRIVANAAIVGLMFSRMPVNI